MYTSRFGGTIEDDTPPGQQTTSPEFVSQYGGVPAGQPPSPASDGATAVQPTPEGDDPIVGKFKGIMEAYENGTLDPEKAPLAAELHRRHSQGLLGSTGKLAMDMIRNAPRSLNAMGEDLLTAVKSPIDTANAVGNMALGAVQKLIPGEQGQEAAFDAVIDDFTGAYGSIEKLNETMAQDPARVVADVWGLVTGLGAGRSAVANAGKTGLQKSTPLLTTGATDAVAKGMDTVASGAAKITDEIIGGTTGVGGEVASMAREGGEAFTKGMRGGVSQDKVIGKARQAVAKVRDNMGSRYKEQKTELSKNTENFDMRPLKQSVKDAMDSDEYNIKVSPEGDLDFSRSTLTNPESQKAATDVIQIISEWGTQAGDNTLMGLDLLKRKLDDVYSPTSKSRALVTKLKKQVTQMATDKVPEYGEMLSDYSKASDFVGELDRLVGSNLKKTDVTTGINKLTKVLKEDPKFRRELMEQLDLEGGSNVLEEMAGTAMSGVKPKGSLKQVGAAAVFINNPILGSMIAAGASPRVMGEFLKGLGYGSKKVKEVLSGMKKAHLFDENVYGAGQLAGRAAEDEEIQQ